jgi:hypothetical protein
LNYLKKFCISLSKCALLPYKPISIFGNSYKLNMLDRSCVVPWMLIEWKVLRHILTSAASILESVTTRNHMENLRHWDLMLTLKNCVMAAIQQTIYISLYRQECYHCISPCSINRHKAVWFQQSRRSRLASSSKAASCVVSWQVGAHT